MFSKKPVSRKHSFSRLALLSSISFIVCCNVHDLPNVSIFNSLL